MRRKIPFRAFFFTWLACWVSWLILTDNTGYREMIVGAISSAITLVAVGSFALATHARYGIRGRFLREAVHIPEILGQGLWVLLIAMARQLRGAEVPSGTAVVRFRPGADDPASRARRALAVSFLTIAPNNLVFGILRDEEIFFFHTVIPQQLPPFVIRLGAMPESEA